ncbi:MAG: pilus assembly protein [Neomegalonema sp.]|nr:pilus assembly protein [Neomegalonema sp.]
MRRTNWKRFLSDARGNLALTFALTLAPMAVIGGLAVEFNYASSLRVSMQQAADSTALALANRHSEFDDAQATGDEMVRAYLGEKMDRLSDLDVIVDFSDSLNRRIVHVDVSGRAKPVSGKLLDPDGFDLSVEAQAEIAFKHVEVALVLDISGSMGRNNKIGKLRDAAKVFVQNLMSSAAATDDGSTGTGNSADEGNSVKITVVPYGTTVKLPAYFAKYMNSSGVANGWEGCLDFGSEIMNDEAFAVNTYHPALDFPSGSYEDVICPTDNPTLLPLESDKTKLLEYIADLDANGWTGTDVGTAFGLKALSPNWRGEMKNSDKTSPRDYDETGVLKVMVVMTDGAIMPQYRAEEVTSSGSGKGKGKGKGKKGKGKGGSSSTSYELTMLYDQDQARTNFLNACQAAKDTNAVTVYTVGFEVPDNWMLSDLKNCASTSSKYFEAEGDELSTIFQTIATDIERLRLTQ